MTDEQKRIKELEDELDLKNGIIASIRPIIDRYRAIIKMLCETLRKNLETYAPDLGLNRDTIKTLKLIENGLDGKNENSDEF